MKNKCIFNKNDRNVLKSGADPYWNLLKHNEDKMGLLSKEDFQEVFGCRDMSPEESSLYFGVPISQIARWEQGLDQDLFWERVKELQSCKDEQINIKSKSSSKKKWRRKYGVGGFLVVFGIEAMLNVWLFWKNESIWSCFAFIGGAAIMYVGVSCIVLAIMDLWTSINEED